MQALFNAPLALALSSLRILAWSKLLSIKVFLHQFGFLSVVNKDFHFSFT
jgi:hypothetical protein